MTLEEWARDPHKTAVKDFMFSLSAWRVWTHMAWMDIKHRYRRSYLGWIWSVAHFLIQTASLALIFCNLLNIMARDFLPYFMIGLATFNFLVGSLVEGGTAFLISEGYIKQLTFPKQVYLLRSWATIAFTYIVNMSVVFVALLVIRRDIFNPGILWVLPGFMLFIAATFLHIWIMSFLCAYFRDLIQITAAIMGIIFYLTPVFYSRELLMQRGLGFLVDLNPFAWLLQVVRDPFLLSTHADPMIYLRAGGYILFLVICTSIVTWRCDKRLVYWL